jgi:hypothetical protein
MRLRVALDVFLGPQRFENRRGVATMSENWAVEAAKKLEQQAEIKQQNDMLTVTEKNIRETQGESLWLDIRRTVEDKCKELNTLLKGSYAVVATTPASEIKVRLTPPGDKTSPRDLQASFRPIAGPSALTWRTSGHKANTSQSVQYELAIERGVPFFRTGQLCTVKRQKRSRKPC